MAFHYTPTATRPVAVSSVQGHHNYACTIFGELMKGVGWQIEFISQWTKYMPFIWNLLECQAVKVLII